MSKYELIIYWSSEDNCYIAVVPELDHLMAHGDTQEETLLNINKAIKLWIKVAKEDNLEIPIPKGRLTYA